MYTYDAAAEGLSRHEPGFQTATVVGRGDIHPTISLPEFIRGWTLPSGAGSRRDHLQPAAATCFHRQLASARRWTRPSTAMCCISRCKCVPPTLARIFDHKPFGYVYKHTFEPYATYRYQTGISNFADIIRFDYRDILADTNEVEYGVINRLYAKKTHSSGKCFRDPHYLPLESVTGAQQWTDKEWAEKRKTATATISKERPKRQSTGRSRRSISSIRPSAVRLSTGRATCSTPQPISPALPSSMARGGSRP